MSRIGKKNIVIPEKVEVKLAGRDVSVKGPKGSLSLVLHPRVNASQTPEGISITVLNENLKLDRSLWGLYSRLVNNLMVGVTAGYSKKLEINGVGYKASLAGRVLTLAIGYSHDITYELPEGISVAIEKNIITVSGIDKQKVGQVAAEIRAFKKPDPYLLKGIKYVDEVIMKKAGKSAAKTA
ncbi:MAG: large subunit ribosomal protein L6 [Parcubacteria group bacterium Gr01-1014_18]|nr:MAG: large subunit ribosomal protein L6 [Parcubacteria group bacterium Greene0416_36]TSC80266.1 MAG: large subunit ribosomal protein L6 [Parcubacteria group bacterium Gr01-1014_18]TSC98245.1 MAG: large subunit ribosomal protein L6 [Parcubacteria group bacterium Greene1014_20]TSD07012.1 MAG: large subunit ribosomal protein L6 [Parcubacteria group bacterium Greene0714_2]